MEGSLDLPGSLSILKAWNYLLPTVALGWHTGTSSYQLTKASGYIFRNFTSWALNTAIVKELNYINSQLNCTENKSNKYSKVITSQFSPGVPLFSVHWGGPRPLCLHGGNVLYRLLGTPSKSCIWWRHCGQGQRLQTRAWFLCCGWFSETQEENAENIYHPVQQSLSCPWQQWSLHTLLMFF